MALDRRRFLSAALAVTTLPAGLKLSYAASPEGHSLIVVFLRGGCDGLNLLAPADDRDLIAVRDAAIRPGVSGSRAGIALANGPSANDWRLHGAAEALKPIYDAGELAFVVATGLVADTRSHFQAQELIERGIAAERAADTGWAARYVAALSQGGEPFAAVAASTLLPDSLAGPAEAVGIAAYDTFNLSRTDQVDCLGQLFAGDAGPLGAPARTTLTAMTDYNARLAALPRDSLPSYGDRDYENGLEVVATLFKLGLAPTVATVEFGGWDTHASQEWTFGDNIKRLANTLARFRDDVAAQAGRYTVVFMTEFGRRVASNANIGTDHGHGSVMLVMGQGIRGGRIHGRWPGLAPKTLDYGDVPVTTDNRQILAEIIKTRGGIADPASLFPGLGAYAPIGLAAGA